VHKRPKPRTGYIPTAVDDEFELVIVCLCEHDHEPLEVAFTQSGGPALVTGNTRCWFGLFEWLTAHLEKKPEAKLLQLWNVRKKKFGTTNMGTTRARCFMTTPAPQTGLNLATRLVKTAQKPVLVRLQTRRPWLLIPATNAVHHH
jgi:hypothetical protein